MIEPHASDSSSVSPAVDLSRVHMIGIGGAGMSGLARILISRGAVVSGSDMRDSAVVEGLRAAGAEVAIGHAEANLSMTGENPSVVVTSFAAIPKDNPELMAAAEAGIPVIRRSDLLAELMRGRRQVLLAGTHGKTSTTSMTVTAFEAAGLDPSFAIGGELNKAGVNARHGNSDIFVAEADESDGSFLSYSPTVAVVTNVEPDHLDYFGSDEAYFHVFDEFAERVVPGGFLVVCLDDDRAAELGLRAWSRGIQVRGYGTSDAVQRHRDIPVGAEIVAFSTTSRGTNIEVAVSSWPEDSSMDAAPEVSSVNYCLQVPGLHMALNSAAALLVGTLVGGTGVQLAQGLSEYTGVRRRFEFHGTVEAGSYAGASVYDDYAHHPTEVAAVLKAAREKADSEGRGGKVVACFQPHLYSRTLNFAAEFAEALSLADAVVMLDVYGAREQPIEGVTSRIITDRLQTRNVYEPDVDAAPRTVASLAGPNDVVLTIGAGSVTTLAPKILKALE